MSREPKTNISLKYSKSSLDLQSKPNIIQRRSSSCYILKSPTNISYSQFFNSLQKTEFPNFPFSYNSTEIVYPKNTRGSVGSQGAGTSSSSSATGTGATISSGRRCNVVNGFTENLKYQGNRKHIILGQLSKFRITLLDADKMMNEWTPFTRKDERKAKCLQQTNYLPHTSLQSVFEGVDKMEDNSEESIHVDTLPNCPHKNYSNYVFNVNVYLTNLEEELKNDKFLAASINENKSCKGGVGFFLEQFFLFFF